MYKARLNDLKLGQSTSWEVVSHRGQCLLCDGSTAAGPGSNSATGTRQMCHLFLSCGDAELSAIRQTFFIKARKRWLKRDWDQATPRAKLARLLLLDDAAEGANSPAAVRATGKYLQDVMDRLRKIRRRKAAPTSPPSPFPNPPLVF